MKKLKMMNAAAHIGCCICGLATMQCACVVAEHPSCWLAALVLTLLFGALTAGLYRLAERIDRALHMTRLQVLQAAQAAKKEMPARNCSYGQAKVAN